MTTVSDYIYVLEANRIVQGFAKKTGKPAEHIEGIWKETEKEMLAKHRFGVTDKYKEIGNIVRSKLGVKSDEEELEASKKAKEADMTDDQKKAADEKKEKKEFKKAERTD